MSVPLRETDLQLDRFHAEVRAALSDAAARIGDARRIKLGDLNLRDNLYDEMKPVVRQLVCHPLRGSYFGSDSQGIRVRLLLLTFMSELVYWEYERSFWNKLYEVLGLIGSPQTTYHWFTRQMRLGYAENGIPLIMTYYRWGHRREYVRTIIGESGFSRQLIHQAKKFVVWFFDNYSDLDPRTLDSEEFEHVLDEAALDWDTGEIAGLMRDMVGAVSRLLREVRRRSLTIADLRNPTVILELQDSLGFHPVRGIFGFRKEEDIQELIEGLSRRVKPMTFRNILRRKIRQGRGTLRVVTPESKDMTIRRAKEVPIVFGEYRLFDPYPSEIQVVPREALTVSRLGAMLQHPKRSFYQDGQYAWIHDDRGFEVYHGSTNPEDSRPYLIGAFRGHLWYGKRKIGIPIRAEQDGQEIASLDPRRDIWLNPRLRLSWDRSGLEVVIPSFICYDPKHAGRTVRLELNGRAIEDTTYVVERNGSLQLQGTRVADVLAEDEKLEVGLVTLDENEIVAKEVLLRSFRCSLLFSRGNRELVRTGYYRHFGGDRYVLFVGTESQVKCGEAVEIESSENFGLFRVYHLRWTPDPASPQPFDLQVGKDKWQFTCPIRVSASLLCTEPEALFHPQERDSAFNPSNVTLTIRFHGNPDEVSQARRELVLIIEKDGDFLTDFSIAEIARMQMLLAESSESELRLDVSKVITYLQAQHLIDRDVGAYRWILMIKPDRLSDMEPISELEFMLLPDMRAEGLEVPMAERRESIVSVLTHSPLLADEDDRPTDVVRLACTAHAEYDKKVGRLRVSPIQKTVRLKYPPTKVVLQFPPRLFAVRWVCKNRARDKSQITHVEARDSHLVVLAPRDDPVLVETNSISDCIELDDEGHGEYRLSQLLPSVQAQRLSLNVIYRDYLRQFQIVWHPTLEFDRARCQYRQLSNERNIVSLAFSADGPPTTEVVFKLSDNRFRSHGEHTVKLASINQGLLEIPIDSRLLGDASILFCSASTCENQLDSVRVNLGEVEEPDEVEEDRRLSKVLENELENADIAAFPDLLDTLENTGSPSLLRQALHHMYSTERLDQLYNRRNELSQRVIHAYTRYFDQSVLPDIRQMSIVKLKKCCALPLPTLQLVCAEGLILQDDGWGVDIVRDLIAEESISLEEGIEVLSRNRRCTSEVVRDMVQWDELERESDSFIELMEALSSEFHPAMAKRARAARDWKRALELLSTGDIVRVRILNWNEKGVTVPLGLITGLVPIEQLDSRRHGLKGNRVAIRSRLQRLVNRHIHVAVIEADRLQGRLIFSEKQAQSRQAQELIGNLDIGSTRQGIVTNVCDFGVFVDLGGIDGLIHKSELAWTEFHHPQEVVSEGDRLEVCILSVNRDLHRIGLSRKRLLPNPILEKLREYRIGQVVRGRVTELVDSGVFISLEAGVRGFVPRAEMSSYHVRHSHQAVKKGEFLESRVLYVDEQNHQLILSVRQVGQDDLYLGSMRIKPSC